MKKTDESEDILSNHRGNFTPTSPTLSELFGKSAGSSPDHQILELGPLDPVTSRPNPFVLSFSNLSYSVQTSQKLFPFSRKKHRTDPITTGESNTTESNAKIVLNSISGEAREGEILAVLGASGSGKSTLIDALANRIKKESLKGSITLNGENLDTKLMKIISAYVMQDDLLYPMLTVQETLMFSAEFRLPSPSTTATPIKLTESTVLSALSAYTNDPALAQEFYSYISSSFTHTPSTFSLLLSILGKHFLFSESKSLLLSSPPHLLLSPLPLRSYFHRLNAARLPHDSIHFFLHHSPSLNLFTSSTFSILIDSLCEHRHVQEAESLALSSSPPFLPDVKIYNLILRGWMKVGAWRKCKDFWVLMDKNKIQKDLHSYSIYMDIMIKCNKAWKAVKVFKDLRKKEKFELDCVVWNTYMMAAGSVDGPDEVVRVLREMKDSGCNPNLVSYNTVVKLFCKEGRIREAYGWLYRMKKSGISPDVFTYHSFFRNSTRPNEILWLFEKMCESKCRPRMDTYVMLMKKFGRWGFLRPVCLVWEKMEEHGLKPDAFAYNAMIDALLDKGMVDLAKKYDDEMVDKGLAAKPRKEFGTRYVSRVDGGATASDDDDDDDENAFSGVL